MTRFRKRILVALVTAVVWIAAAMPASADPGDGGFPTPTAAGYAATTNPGDGGFTFSVDPGDGGVTTSVNPGDGGFVGP